MQALELRYEWIVFLEIGVDRDLAHFLIQSTLDHSPNEIIRTIKSLTAMQIFEEHLEVRKKLWEEHSGPPSILLQLLEKIRVKKWSE